MEVNVNTKQFAVATAFFTIVSLGVIFGLAFLFGKLLIPPSSLDELATNYLGKHGPLALVLTSFVLGVGLVFLLTKKLLVPRLTRHKA